MPQKTDRVPKTCLFCGTVYEIKRCRAVVSKYCSRDCKDAHRSQLYIGAGNPQFRNASEKHCIYCGSIYYSLQPTRKYCSSKCYRENPAQKRGNDFANCKFRTCSKCGGRSEAIRRHEPPRRCATCRVKPPSIRQQRNCAECGELFVAFPSSPRKFCSKRCATRNFAPRQSGSRSHRWEGGKTKQTSLFRNSIEYAEWRRSVFNRDGFICQICFERGGKLAAHHILTFRARRDLALVIANGITLCWPCHRSIKGRESEYEDQFFAITGGLQLKKDGAKPPSARKLTENEEKTKAKCEQRGIPYLILVDVKTTIETLGQFR